MSCIFCKIINKELPSNILWENNDLLAIEDVNPVTPVHCLIIPKSHVATVAEMDGDQLKSLPKCVEDLIIKKNLKKYGYRLITNAGFDGGQEVDHIHFHLLGGKKLGKMK